MKILFFIERLGGGGKERRLVELIKGLSLNPDVNMEIVLTRKGILYKDILSINIKIHYAIRKGFKKDPRIFFKFFKIANSFKPDVIHVWGNLVAIYAIPTKILLGVPMINNQIGDVPNEISRSIFSHKLSFPFSDKIIANSYAGLKAYNAPKEKSSVIYNGFDFDRIRHLENKGDVIRRFKIKTKFIIGMVANFSVKKDYSSYIKAANIILKYNNDVTFLCIGEGDYSKYKQMVVSNNKDKVFFLGEQSNVENIMNICDIGVLSTYTEGISNALLEFSALGKPVITTFGGGNVELVENGETGFLINQESPKELVEKIKILMNDEVNRINFGNKGKEKILNEFSIESMIKKFTSVYTDILKV